MEAPNGEQGPPAADSLARQHWLAPRQLMPDVDWETILDAHGPS